MQKEVIELGKLFVKELRLERNNNTFSRWIAHYIAEKIKKAENLKGEEKKKAEDDCFNAILKLWKHRWVLPHGKRPLENFEPILNLLQKLAPEKDDPYFFPVIPTELKPQNDDKPEIGSSQFWVEVAEQIDKVARIWIQDILKLAGEAANDERTAEWLVSSVNVPDNDDRNIIQLIIREKTLDEELEPEEIIKGDALALERKYEIEKHKHRIDLLERYIKLNEFLIDYHKSELTLLEKTETKTKKRKNS